ncbi:RecBCD enzyme subunit RecC [Arenimonas soli]|uniref:RecBCD enzyme subunit RecC n=1 Tax=Arenimonas soli TaxID=2269504 RepID=A0ABQ1HTG0_9GAMM|nr:exodeoxyribonuclease V subunit gamma [Arenimonas soli]GGA87749.1 RecBCD enzyme subunit RecC [Arenimonas soli]
MQGDWKQRASEGITVFRASRLEALLEPLDYLLSTQAPASPLAPQTVVAAHPGMRQWLAGALAGERDLGSIVANLDIVLPTTFLDGLARQVLGENAVSPRGWRREWLRWRVHELLESPSDPALQAYLTGPDRALRRFQLADRLARIYIQYMAYRPDWLDDWGYSRDTFDGAGFHPGLWRQLRQALKEPHRGERLMELGARLRAGGVEVGATDPLHVFGLSHMAPAELAVLQALAVHRPVVFYLPDPCREYWAGLRSERARLLELAADPHGEDATAYFLDQGHPLLAAWGRLGQHFMLSIQQLEASLDIRHFRDEREGDDSPVRLLDRTQQSLRTLDPALMASDGRSREKRLQDRSLRVHACHSRLRELEALRDALLRERAENKKLEPADIVVMAPDIGAYLPLLPAVFGEPGRAEGPLPYHLADVPMARAQPLFSAFRQLLAMPSSRLTAPELVDFLAQPPVLRRLGLDEGDLDTLTQWLARARAAWGLDGATRAALGVPPTEPHTLAWAMDRLVAGFIHGNEADDDILRLPDNDALVPVSGVAGSASTALGALDHLLQQLAGLRADVAAERTASEWARRLEDRLDALFLPDFDDPRGPEAMDQLRALLRSLASEPGELGLDPVLAFPVVKQWLEERLSSVPERQRFLAGGITVCGMVPQRAIPFRVVAVLGLNEGEYPRSDADAGLDPIGRPGLRRLGDRDVRSDDRYLFLETLMSARDALHLSYVAFDQVGGSARNPAAPLAELMAALPPGDKDEAGEPRAPTWRVDHKLQPFHADYFNDSDPRLFSFSAGFAAMVGDEAGAMTLLSDAAPPPDADVREVSMAELRRYFRDPARVQLADRLGARLDALDDGGLTEDEPLEARMERLDSPARALCLHFLSHPDASRDVSAPEAMQLAGLLPAGRLGEAAWQKELDAALAVDATARERDELKPLLAAGLPPPTPLPMRRDFGRFHVTGDLGTGYDGGDVLYVLDVFPNREKENALDLRERLPLFLAWAMVRLAPENAGRAVHLCALVQKEAGRSRDCNWQAGIARWDSDYLRAPDKTPFLEDLEANVLELLELWAHPATHPAWYFPRAAAALAIRQKDDAAEGAWQAERGYAPGYARLLGRGLDFEEGTPHFERLKAGADDLMRLITPGGEGAQ